MVEYLGRYTHKIAISNHRIRKVDGDKVSFTYKDYRHGSANKEMILECAEFIRRYALHILPKNFVRIRHYGIISSTSKEPVAVCIKSQLPAMAPVERIRPLLQNYDQEVCPCCKEKTMHRLLQFDRRGPRKDTCRLPLIFYMPSFKKLSSTAGLCYAHKAKKKHLKTNRMKK